MKKASHDHKSIETDKARPNSNSFDSNKIAFDGISLFLFQEYGRKCINMLFLLPSISFYQQIKGNSKEKSWDI
jgi:hypothetical protein